MRPEQAAGELAHPQPVPGAMLEDPHEAELPQRPVRALRRLAFCFAWLFELEPFLAASSNDMMDSRFERH